MLAQDSEPRIPVLAFIDEKLDAGRLDGYQYADMPDDRDTWRLVARGLDKMPARGAASYASRVGRGRQEIADDFARGSSRAGPGMS